MNLTRRQFVTGIGAAGSAAALGGCGQRLTRQGVTRDGQRAGRPFTFVHLTDQHVTRRRQGEKGYQTCIESINALRPRPAFVLMGGDMVFDGCYTEKSDYEDQIRIYRDVTSRLTMPYYHCMGNHEPLGWSGRRKVPVSDPDFGKKMIMERLGWEKSYYSFDHGGWHFAVLDSTYPISTGKGPSQEARIGAEQLEWLAYDLGAAGDRPKIAVTHVAAFCAIGQVNGDPKRSAVDGDMVLHDTKDLRKILERHKVKALLQGHSHWIEEYRFKDVWYLTSAAGGGAWWAGSWTGAEPGYTVLQCDGDQLTWRHATFTWEPRLDPQDDLERRKIAEQAAERATQQRLLNAERRGIRLAAQTEPAEPTETAAETKPAG